MTKTTMGEEKSFRNCRQTLSLECYVLGKEKGTVLQNSGLFNRSQTLARLEVWPKTYLSVLPITLTSSQTLTVTLTLVLTQH